MLPTVVPRDNGPAPNAAPVCVRCGNPPLVRHLDIGWLCCDCAAAEGYPLAQQLKLEYRLLEGLAALYPLGMPRVVKRHSRRTLLAAACLSRAISVDRALQPKNGVSHAEAP